MNISGLVHINLTFENICIGFVTDSNEETCCSDTVLFAFQVGSIVFEITVEYFLLIYEITME